MFPPGCEPGTSSLSGMIMGLGGYWRSGEIPYGTRGFTSQRIAAFCVVFRSHVHAMCTRVTAGRVGCGCPCTPGARRAS